MYSFERLDCCQQRDEQCHSINSVTWTHLSTTVTTDTSLPFLLTSNIGIGKNSRRHCVYYVIASSLITPR